MRTLLLLLLSASAAFAQLNISSPFYVAGVLKPSSGYAATSTRFTTDDSLSRANFTGEANGKTGLFSCWVKSYSAGNLEIILSNSGFDTRIEKTTAGVIRVLLKDIIGPTDSVVMSSTASVEGGAWHHVAAMWDSTDSAKCKIYIDGTEGTTLTTRTDLTIDYTHSSWLIARASFGMDMDISEMYFAPNQWIDLASDITKFRSTGAAPVSLGADGSTPTGVQPILYYKDPNTSLVNLGSGGDFTVASGTLAAGSAIP